MKMKTISYFSFFSALLVGMLLGACSSDEPKEPTPDAPGYTQEEIAKALPGAWVTEDENGNWNRMEFSELDEKGHGTYVWLTTEGRTPERNLQVNQGTAKFYTANSLGTCYLLQSDICSTKIQTYLLYPTSIKGMEINWRRLNGISDNVGDKPLYKSRRILATIFGNPGSEYEVELPDAVKSMGYTIGDSPSPIIAVIDKSTCKVNINSCGTVYIPVMTEEGTGCIEVTGSPLTKMPFDVDHYIGLTGSEVMTDEGLQMYWGKDLSPLDQEYPGISDLSYHYGLYTMSWYMIYTITIEPDIEMTAYAMWLLGEREGELNSANKTDIVFLNSNRRFFVDINIEKRIIEYQAKI